MTELRLFLRKIDQKVISKGKHYLLTLIILYRYKTNEVLDHYKEQTPQKEEPIGATSPIWVCWWQGEKKMPDIVKVCYSSICRHADNHPVILITEKNFQEYATMPDFIMQRLYKREMTITHFSDLLRMNLLKRHGGIWLDSTILLTKDIDSIINTSLPYYSHHHIPNNLICIILYQVSSLDVCNKVKLLTTCQKFNQLLFELNACAGKSHLQ